jgi:hypothetical protein
MKSPASALVAGILALHVFSGGPAGPNEAAAQDVTANSVELSGGSEGAHSSSGIESYAAGGAGASEPSKFVGGERAPVLCKSDEPLSVLFIGNSYTHYFDMPGLLEGMAASAGCRVEAEMVAPGGSRLDQHVRSGETLSAIGSRAWDVVVLQNFSQLPSQRPEVVREKTFPSVLGLVTAIENNHPSTKIVYYVTWGRRDGDKTYCADYPMVCSFEGHTAALRQGYTMYAEEFGGQLADVGGAFARIGADRSRALPRRKLYDPDGSHPSMQGSYLAASVFFATLFNASPQGLAYPEGLKERHARYIQRIAGQLPISGA